MPETEMFAVVELMGHVSIAGKVTQEEMFGVTLGRIDTWRGDGSIFTKYFSGQSIYSITPVSEEVARIAAKRNAYEPVHQWELPKRLPFQEEIEVTVKNLDMPF